jgi:hypothetical protein
MKITGSDHTTRRQTNLLQDGIGRHFGISRRELGAGSCAESNARCIRRTSRNRQYHYLIAQLALTCSDLI